MSTTVMKPKMVVSIADDIQGDATLMKIVEVGNEFLHEEYPAIPASEDTVRCSLNWTQSTLDGVRVLIPKLEEFDDDGSSRTSRELIPISLANDTNSLKIEMIHLLRQISHQRYEKVKARWDRLLDAMEEEQSHGG
jgi:hypothetical protein